MTSLILTEDQKLIDSVSSWWCMIHGYKHPELTAAIKEQADRFCHVMLGGLTHEPVQQLSEKLQTFLPGDLDYCFFSDSGSVAVEVSLKMALQYNTNLDRKRPMVLAECGCTIFPFWNGQGSCALNMTCC